MALFVAGLSHKNAPVELREQLAVEEDKLRELLRDIAATGVVQETLILSTCNRVEVYGVAEAPGEARAVVFRQLCRYRGVSHASVEPLLYTHVDDAAVHHAFRVAASLDSMLIGEPQILGQVKDAFALAQSCEAVGPALHSLFTQAFAVAKKVRTETQIARHAVSVSFAAVELAKKIFAGLEGKAVLLVGAGKMSELAAKQLVEQGAFPVYVTNRTWARAQELARALSGTAVPCDVEPGVDGIDVVYRYDIDDLKQVVDANLRERAREAQRAETLVEREVSKFAARLRDVEVVPTIVSLRERLETIRLAELRRALARVPDATAETREAMEALSSAIVNKILHAPVTKLRESGRAGVGRSWTTLVQELFGLRRGS